jgi:hypothetical protein
MKSINHHSNLAKQTGTPHHTVSIQIARIVVNNHTRWRLKPLHNELKRGMNGFIFLHRTKPENFGMWTADEKQPRRKMFMLQNMFGATIFV